MQVELSAMRVLFELFGFLLASAFEARDPIHWREPVPFLRDSIPSYSVPPTNAVVGFQIPSLRDIFEWPLPHQEFTSNKCTLSLQDPIYNG